MHTRSAPRSHRAAVSRRHPTRRVAKRVNTSSKRRLATAAPSTGPTTHKQDSTRSPASSTATTAAPAIAVDDAHAPAASSTPPATQYTKRMLFEHPLSNRERFIGVGIPLITAVQACSTIAAAAVNPDNLVLPAACVALYFGLGRYFWLKQRDRVISLAVEGPNDPIILTVPKLLGTKEIKIPRSDLTGLSPSEHTGTFVQPAFPFILNVRNRQTPYTLARAGLYDASGDLTNILGYDVITYQRAFPSQPYDEEQAEAESRKLQQKKPWWEKFKV